MRATLIILFVVIIAAGTFFFFKSQNEKAEKDKLIKEIQKSVRLSQPQLEKMTVAELKSIKKVATYIDKGQDSEDNPEWQKITQEVESILKKYGISGS